MFESCWIWRLNALTASFSCPSSHKRLSAANGAILQAMLGLVMVGFVLASTPSLALGGSCKGHCGKWDTDCWCNDGCESHGDCCPDYHQQCAGPSPSPGSCPKCSGYTCDEWIAWNPKKYNCPELQKDYSCDCTGCKCSPPAPSPGPSPGSCPKCSGYTCDEWIAWNSTKYNCPELQKEYSCDCTGCKCSSAGPSPAPTSHGNLKEVLFSQQRYPGAVCLDGSPAGYYIRHGSPDAFVVYFEGGGWCYDQNCASPSRQGTLKNCAERSEGALGSSRKWSTSRVQSRLSGMLSDSAKQNPVFYNYTLVYVPYCDGASFTGDAEVPYQGGLTLHFKGSSILDAVVAELKHTTNITAARRIVLSGGSAGASTVYYHADKIVAKLGVPDTSVVAIPDAGFFLNLKDKDGIDCWPSQMRSVWEVANAYKDLHAGCLAKYSKDQWKCLFPEYYADLIKTRWMNIMSLYDSSELWSTLRLDCSPGGSGSPQPGAFGPGQKRRFNITSYPACTDKEMELFQSLRQQHLAAWKPLVEKRGNGQWAPSCITHTMTWGKWTDQSWEVPANSGNTMAAAVKRWLDGDDLEGHGFNYTDTVAWPQNAPCSGADTAIINI